MLILASASPRRRELLDQIGVAWQAHPVDVEEIPLAGESPEDFTLRMAVTKARSAHDAVPGHLPVLGADTVVSIDGDILGKPRDREDALDMLGRLSGRTHEVLSAVALLYQGCCHQALSTTRVRFRDLSPADMDAYWASGEPADKAGAYGIQGLGALFVAHIEGSYSGVVGLPLFETGELLRRCGLISGIDNQT
ncbi:septum formation protein Maf [Ectothiorhodospira shaposhnikovii]|uniref:Maf family protein n=1 Tax=Ectothiorhodospira shaposhnikovii TaxID=1054 RepID=UPI00190624D8|nr:nucleoside triphosphate pyrophosphatase [Ectothiorhodospira shaposhnikovii]MBK1674379.1 septum formation protein Maf [Ectothiorhodospira shaposhnikovii]